MDALLELSGAAEGKTTTPPSLSGFEMAAALLEQRPSHLKSSTVRSVIPAASDYKESRQELSPGTTRLTEEFDSLIDQELESLTMPQPVPSSVTPSIFPLPSESVPLSSGAPPSPLLAQEALQELDQLDVENYNLGSLSEQRSDSPPKIGGAKKSASPINELSLGGVFLPQESGISIDFSHLTHDSSSAAPRPSAFKAYRRPDQLPKQISTPVPHSQSLHKFWNLQTPDFKRCMDEPTFITPIVQAPNPWTTNPTSMTQWMLSKPVGQAPLKPSATVPKSWMLSPQSRLKLEGQVLVLLRGAPGSGKSTLARY